MRAKVFNGTDMKAPSRAGALSVLGQTMTDRLHLDPAATREGGRCFAQRRRGQCAGFTYIGLLMLVAIMGIALTVVAEVWQTAQKRDKEEELLFVGSQIRRAIAMYVANGAGYPRRLEDLLKDPGFPEVRRNLRKIYRDPITGRAEWGLVKPDGNYIIGAYSLSDSEPSKQRGFSLADRGFEGKTKYSEWIFSPSMGQSPATTVRRAGSATPQPGTSQPDIAQHGIAQPDAAQSAAAQPSIGQPDTAQSASAQIGATQSGTPQSGTSQDDSTPFQSGRTGSRGRR